MGVHNFKDLIAHAGHELKCVTYNHNGKPQNVSIECITCNEVLLDFDRLSEEEPENNPLLKPIADKLLGVYFKEDQLLKLFYKAPSGEYRFIEEYEIEEEEDCWEAINIADVHSPFRNTEIGFFGIKVEELDINFGYGDEFGTFLSIYPVISGTTISEYMYPVKLKVLEADDPCYYLNISECHVSEDIINGYGQCAVPVDKPEDVKALSACPGFEQDEEADDHCDCIHCWIENSKGHCQLWLDLDRVNKDKETDGTKN